MRGVISGESHKPCFPRLLVLPHNMRPMRSKSEHFGGSKSIEHSFIREKASKILVDSVEQQMKLKLRSHEPTQHHYCNMYAKDVKALRYKVLSATIRIIVTNIYRCKSSIGTLTRKLNDASGEMTRRGEQVHQF